MSGVFTDLNWWTIGASVVVGQAILTIWFAVLFADPWARAYGAADKAQHTAEIPGYTYAIGLVCMILLVLGLAVLQRLVGVDGAGAGLAVGIGVALHFCIATALPGYAFLQRWTAFSLAIGGQIVVIAVISMILATWR